MELAVFVESTGTGFVEHLKCESTRTGAVITASVVLKDSNGRLRNQCLFIIPETGVAFVYNKVHLTGTERDELQLKSGDEFKVFDYQGVRYGFATCFDIYFPGYFEALAIERINVLINPSYQRSETAERIELLSRLRAFDTGAVILRSSYAMSQPGYGGHSLIALPDASIAANAGEQAQVIHAEINPGRGFIKPASHGRDSVQHRSLILNYSRPQVYNAGNLFMAGTDGSSRTPVICAHRGLSGVMPENTLPAFAAAVSVGAQEIEFDLWLSHDGVPVVCHDPDLKRVAGVDMMVIESNWEDIRKLDVGEYHQGEWTGVKIARFEEVVKFFANQVIMNIHIKDPGKPGALVKMVCDVIRENGMINSAYIAGDRSVLRAAREYAAEVHRCCLDRQDEPDLQLESAIRHECFRAQLFTCVSEAQIQAFRRADIQCSVFYADTVQQAKEWHDKGIDVVLTNYAHTLCDHFQVKRDS